MKRYAGATTNTSNVGLYTDLRTDLLRGGPHGSGSLLRSNHVDYFHSNCGVVKVVKVVKSENSHNSPHDSLRTLHDILHHSGFQRWDIDCHHRTFLVDSGSYLCS